MKLLYLQNMSTDAKDFTQNSFQMPVLLRIRSINSVPRWILLSPVQILWITLPGKSTLFLRHHSLNAYSIHQAGQEIAEVPFLSLLHSCHLRGWPVIWARVFSFRGFSSQRGDCKWSLCTLSWASEGTAAECRLLEKNLRELPDWKTVS